MGFGDGFNDRDIPAPPVRRPDELITVYDERGRAMHIRRAAWVDNVLSPALQKAWNDAQQLAGQIAQALHDDFVEHVRHAAERLVTLDNESEGALVLAAIVRMECGDLDGAREALDRSVRKYGPSGAVLANLAKLYEKVGDKINAKTTLRRSLDLDPNQESLLWWATLAKEERGDAGFVAALEEIANVPGAWRPHLWLARERLKAGDRPAALALYERVLATADERSDVMTMITGDLGSAGALEELVRLAAPRYVPERHGPNAGLNVVRAYKQLGRTDEARALVRRLQTMNWPPFAGPLAALEAEIVAASPPQAPQAAPEIAVYVFERPLWTSGLFEPDWMFRRRDTDEPAICFVTFANETLKAEAAHVRLSEARGRLTRSLPLYLAESIGLGYRVQSSALMLVSPLHGPAVFGQPLEQRALEARLPAHPGHRIVVAGSLVADGIRLYVWEAGHSDITDVLDVGGRFDELGVLVAATEKAMIANLERRGLSLRSRPPAFYQAPSADLLTGYTLALEQLFYQLLAASDIVSPKSLWNERGFFETYFNLVDAWPGAPESARLIAVCGALAAVKYHSAIVAPYRAIVLRWLDEAAIGSLLYRLAPAVFKGLGDVDSFERSLAKLPRLADASYMAWLDRVKADV